MEEMPSQNIPVQRLKVAILPLDVTSYELVTHSGKILTTESLTRRSWTDCLQKY